MKVNGKDFTTIWLAEDGKSVGIIDQTCLPHEFRIKNLRTFEDALFAIDNMLVRGAPLIGVTAAFAMYLAAMDAENENDPVQYLMLTSERLKKSRPTAVDLFKAVDYILDVLKENQSFPDIKKLLLDTAQTLRSESVNQCKFIGQHGLALITEMAEKKKGKAVNILTHCNAGWLATVDYGTALAPVYLAFEKGIPLHIWVDETRPRNQGAGLTAWELLNHGVRHTIIADNAGGHLMQHGMVDMVIVGTDRTTRRGDVANKIGTYLKALAASDNQVPFYVAAPFSSIDFSICDGLTEIRIEQRSEDEIKYVSGLSEGKIRRVLISPGQSPASNYGFDVTPARLISGFITERGICPATEKGLTEMFSDMMKIR